MSPGGWHLSLRADGLDQFFEKHSNRAADRNPRMLTSSMNRAIRLRKLTYARRGLTLDEVLASWTDQAHHSTIIW
jgi:hypothetical protein